MKQVGKVAAAIIDLLVLAIQEGEPIFIGDENDKHIADEHPVDYEDYRGRLDEIIQSPTYVVPHHRDKTLQYVKSYGVDLVLVAVRPSKSGRWFVRSLYRMSDEKIAKFTEHDLFNKYQIK